VAKQKKAKTTARKQELGRKMVFGEKDAMGSLSRRTPVPLHGNDEHEKEEEEEEEEEDEDEDEDEEEEDEEEKEDGWSD